MTTILTAAQEDDSVYSAILDVLEAVDWDLASTLGVTKLTPSGKHENLNFFPGNRGFVGPAFPVGGVMLVANNFDNLTGWDEYKRDHLHLDSTGTWRNIREILIPSTGIPWHEFWFTNYSLGVMEQPNSRYEFPASVRSALKFSEHFEAFVGIMKPRLIVTLGKPVSQYLQTDYSLREREDIRMIGSCRTRIIAAVHPCAWTWQRRGFSANDFSAEGHRIAAAAAKPLPVF